MTQYLLAVHMVEGEAPPEDMEGAYKAVDVFNDELKTEGAWVFAGGLHPADAALALAGRGAAACRAPVEVRPFQDDPEG